MFGILKVIRASSSTLFCCSSPPVETLESPAAATRRRLKKRAYECVQIMKSLIRLLCVKLREYVATGVCGVERRSILYSTVRVYSAPSAWDTIFSQRCAFVVSKCQTLSKSEFLPFFLCGFYL